MLAIHRLDRRSSLPVRRRALPPAGLAARSRSRRPPRRILLPPPRPPEPPHTPFAWNREAFRRKLRSRRKRHSMDDKAEKVALFRYGLIAPAGAGNAAPRRTHAPRPGDRRPPLRHSPFHPPPGLGGHAAGLDAALSPQRTSTRCRPSRARTADRPAPSPTATAALIERLKRENPHRTGTALLRELAAASERNQAGHFGFHALSFPARPRPHRTPTAARQSHRAQKVRSRVRQPDLAIRHALRPLGRSAPAAAR